MISENLIVPFHQNYYKQEQVIGFTIMVIFNEI